MAAYLSLGDTQGPTVRIHDEIVEYLWRAGPGLGIALVLLPDFDPYGDYRQLSDDELVQLQEEAQSLDAKLREVMWTEPLAPELLPPEVVGVEMGSTVWGREGAIQFAQEVAALVHVARKFDIPLVAWGD